MAVTTKGDMGVWPVLPDRPHQASQMAAYLRPGRGLARPQQHRHRPRGGGVIDVDRQEAAFAVMRLEQL